MLGAPVTVTAPAVMPVTRDQVKTFLRIDGTALDDQLDILIAAAVGELESTSGLRLIDQVVRVQATRCADLDHLTVGPARAIVAMAYRAGGGPVDIDVGAAELGGSDIDQWIQPLAAWPAEANRHALSIDLAVGYGPEPGNVPAPLRLILLQMIRGLFDERPVDHEQLLTNHRINA